MLAVAPHTAYVHEPFNIGIDLGVTPKVFKYWFQHVCEESPPRHKAAVAGSLRYAYPLASNLARVRTLGDVATVARDQRLCLLHRLRRDTPIVKDPIAFFSAEWLSETFDMNVLVMIRHPAAFCASVKIKTWTFDFNNFLLQPALMKKYLGRFERDIRDCATNQKGIIDQAILLWNCIQHTVSIYQKTRPEWLYVRHEDLSVEPLDRFRSIYDAFGLEFTPQAKLMILGSSGPHNPVGGRPENELMRNSRENIHSWKTRLNRREIDLIRERTSEVSTSFYSESEW